MQCIIDNNYQKFYFEKTMKNWILFFYTFGFVLVPIFAYSQYEELKTNAPFPFRRSALICINSKTRDSHILQVNQYKNPQGGSLACDAIQYGYTTDSEMFSPDSISYHSPVSMTMDQGKKYIVPLLSYGNHKYFDELGDLVDITNLLYKSGSCIPFIFSTMQCFDSDTGTTSFFEVPVFMYSKVVHFSTKNYLGCDQYQKNTKKFFVSANYNCEIFTYLEINPQF